MEIMDEKDNNPQNNPNQIRFYPHPDRLRSYFHPAQFSISIGVIVFFAYFLFNVLSFLISKELAPLWVTNIFVLSLTFFMGLGGFVMIVRKEYIDEHGLVETGCWAYVLGTFFVIVGWGFFLFAVYFIVIAG
jgi:hypothetical protein